jgi:exodeoxyribonuclease V beta subunit
VGKIIAPDFRAAAGGMSGGKTLTARQKFDAIETPLSTGATLIEASAGTGKTFTIAALLLRLILERDLRIEEILVTTYTELATAELRDRIRTLLRRAIKAFATGASDDPLIAQLLARHRRDAQAAPRLEDALRSFDEAPIHTIHGFCQRMLKDRAFESGALFDAELITDQSAVLREIADDFWRTHFYSGDVLLTLFAARNKLSAETFLAHLQGLTNNPTLRVIPAPGVPLETLKTELCATWKSLGEHWRVSASEIRALFEDLSWAKYTHGDRAKVDALLADLDQCLAKNSASAQLDCLEKFTNELLKKNTRSKSTAPKHAFFDECGKLFEQERKFFLGVQAEFFEWARVELRRRKVSRNVISFDDLLTRLNEALGGPNGVELARGIREKFKAALVDEFQDTDPVQYSIFSRIYDGSDAPVFFIGDPKQAIYGFRGADVFTYIAAADHARSQFTLSQNWRSESSLIAATNAFFGLQERPFVLEGIPFSPVEASGKADETPLTINGAKEPPLQIWLADDDEPLTNKAADALLPDLVAGEIGRLLSGDAKIGNRRVEPRDIAVLVAENAEAQLVQDALSRLQIPSVVYSAANVFKSREAGELARILAAVVEPAQEKFVRAALSTDVLGVSGDALDALTRDERAWETRLIQFAKYHQLWRDRGFIQMLRTLSVEQGVRGRLLSYRDGERRLTNLLQFAELLHTVCGENRLGMTGVLKWLGEQTSGGNALRSDDYELRLESDAEAVRIATIHKSKGLEYGIVFCPFCWGDAKTRAAVMFHGTESGGLTLDLEGSEENERAQFTEALAEKMRLLYVALTRAKHRSYLVWGNFKGGKNSAPAYLFGGQSDDALGSLEARGKGLTSAQVRREIEQALGAQPSIAITSLPTARREVYRAPAEETGSGEARVFHGEIDRSWGMSSFTALIRGDTREIELPGDDEIDSAEPAMEIEIPASGIFAFPRGAGPGTCLHQIFEEIDFADLRNLPEVAARKLRAFSIRGFDEVVCEAITNVLAVPLELNRPEFTLSRIAAKARLTELEFSFPIDSLTPDRLAVPSRIGRLQFSRISGFMKGFVDLVFEHEEKFYIVDWKSNWLGADASAYAAPALAAEMARKLYTLQLQIYTVALHRYLSVRKRDYDFEKHFGGAFYIFLRGADPARPELGIHRARPTREFIEGMSAMLSHAS